MSTENSVTRYRDRRLGASWVEEQSGAMSTFRTSRLAKWSDLLERRVCREMASNGIRRSDCRDSADAARWGVDQFSFNSPNVARLPLEVNKIDTTCLAGAVLRKA